jgi:hypothetical protein
MYLEMAVSNPDVSVWDIEMWNYWLVIFTDAYNSMNVHLQTLDPPQFLLPEGLVAEYWQELFADFSVE